MKFELQHTDTLTSARTGVLTTEHGPIETPVFMPVGTVGSVKAVHPWELKEDIKAQIILGNTYHLYLRPGIEILGKAGGLHKFNSFNVTPAGGTIFLLVKKDSGERHAKGPAGPIGSPG